MKFNIRGKKIEITDSIRSYIESKIGRLDKYFKNQDEITANILVKLRGKGQVIEVTINTKGFTLRGEEMENDLYAAIDIVSEKIERQIRKNKTRMHKKINKEKVKEFDLSFEESIEEETSIVKRKVIDTKPMSEEEAILQLELIGHDFFVFKNADTDEYNVIYKRKDNNYGLIEIK